jgi:alpha-glucosidase (family GH31 glycosyl hydrolase)
MRSYVQQPIAESNAMVTGDKFRFTVLTDQLLRIEYAEDGLFEDRATQAVVNRQFPIPQFQVIQDEVGLEIITEHLHLYYSYGEFSKNSLRIDALNNYSLYHNRWFYGESFTTLKGTARTLDFYDGARDLEEGIQSPNGFAVIDDSTSCILEDDETILSRKKGIVDMYFFAHGRDYLQGLRALYQLTGSTPLLPRYTLGNWWSRYWKYSEQEYMELMERFKDEDVPFSVSVIDMDWHIVDDVPARYGSGWTGYTWNKDLFPDPERFLQWLHQNGLRVTLNVHPSDGARPHEEAYRLMAEELGINPDSEQPIPFDITDRKFRDAYFKYLHHPDELRGNDFWWIDWQQGEVSKVEGADPLWMLNHYHSLDMIKRNKRPVVLSRYAGVGSHRYPIGFSGDTLVSWESLQFQPYYTATASNIGYTWWSHDIGGHFQGIRDDELSLRWVQFGVFSPMMRLHSSSSLFTGKEPWNYQSHISDIMMEYLRLRHRFLPYLYTMNWRTHRNDHPLMMPMYYYYPLEHGAYEVPNQYFFGSELIVAPVTTKINSELLAASVEVWLPEGQWVDFFSGRVYTGGRKLQMFRGLDSLPVLAKAGAIIPLQVNKPHDNSIENPEHLELVIVPGAHNTFEMFEDDGISFEYESGAYATTTMEWNEAKSSFTLHAVNGSSDVVPAERDVTLRFRGVKPSKAIRISIDGELISDKKSASDTCVSKQSYDVLTNTLTVEVKSYRVVSTMVVQLAASSEVGEAYNSLLQLEHDYKAGIIDILLRAQISFNLKDDIVR